MRNSDIQAYACVVQDFRGRFDSEGDDYPVFVHDGWGEHPFHILLPIVER
jgi:hypothetical protein